MQTCFLNPAFKPCKQTLMNHDELNFALTSLNQVIPFQEPFDLAVALRPHLLKSSVLGHVMVEAAGDLRLFSSSV